ncbi:MAG: hypothetical protein ACI8X5_000606 [Planctomycetota bacterium]|jgi:hypothetical protein
MNRIRMIFVGAACLLLLAAGWQLMDGGAQDRTAATPSASGPVDGMEDPEGLLLPAAQVEQAPSVQPVHLPEAEAVSEREVLQTADAKAKAKVLHGTISFFDPDGVPQAAPTGMLGMRVFRNGSGSLFKTRIESGIWSLTLDHPEEIAELWINNIAVPAQVREITYPVGRFELPSDMRLAITATVPPQAVLRVTDLTHSHELDDLVLLARLGGLNHPGSDHESRVLARNLSSPINVRDVLPSSATSYSQLFVGGSGYTWAAVRIVRTIGGLQEIQLQRAGSLEVFLSGDEAVEDLELQLFSLPDEEQQAAQVAAKRALLLSLGTGDRSRISATPAMTHVRSFSEMLDGRRSIRIDGLAPGRFEARIESGPSRDRQILGSTEIEVRVGSLTRKAINVEVPPPAEFAMISGRLILADEWNVKNVRVNARPLDQRLVESRNRYAATIAPLWTSARPGCTEYTLQFDRLQVGFYEIQLSYPHFAITIEVLHGGSSELILDVPPPKVLSVDVIDALTGERIKKPNLSWRVPGWGSQEYVPMLHPDLSTGSFVLRTAYTSGELLSSSSEYQMKRVVIDLPPGDTQYTLKLTPKTAAEGDE